MPSYVSRLKADVSRWVEQGMIDQATGQLLVADAEVRNERSFNFGSVLAIMAALLLGAAILLLVAANWEAIPRLVRVGTLFALIFGFYVGGAWLKQRGRDALAEACWLIAAAAFGGSIALVGQMYHLSGDEASAILTWCAGTALAAAALRSSALTVAAVAIAMAWMVMRGIDDWDIVPQFYLVMAAAFWLISYWTQSRPARHLILLSLILYMCIVAAHHDTIAIGIALAIGSALLFILATRAPEPVERIVLLDRRLPVHCLLGFLVGLALAQIDLVDEGGRLALAAVVTFGGIAAALIIAGRESRMLRWLAYTGFGLELAFIYAVMIGTMLGTAGLFLASGVVLGIIALFIIRIERRIRARPVQGGQGA
ncbi:DUF2157 domain-containing protein [Pseudaminobacter arsenicus]|uniref:DUF2157 domain-containing protein n=1 Tax=Borborobacter arsenicus TaxID=1851146 RepID=A0A432V9B3_9HYPH|nr:DUF2157 domain-containing protein [Pseudaminobacter arsenicus]RUM98683.1 DUF2157 domain-containing protein [Pseudaminobacter arsenicus]